MSGGFEFHGGDRLLLIPREDGNSGVIGSAKIPAFKEFADTRVRHRACMAAKGNDAVCSKSCKAVNRS